MKKILLTGCNGFLGSHLLNKLLEKSQSNEVEKIIGIDNFISSNKANLKVENEKCNFIEADLIKFDFNKLEKCDAVIHLASLASPVYYKKFPLETIDVGTTVTRKLLERCREWEAKFIFFSSSEIYGNPSIENIPTKESYKGYVSCQGPRSCYDESKRLGETLCYVYNVNYNVKTNIIRPFNIYGDGMDIKSDYRMIPNLIKSCLVNKKLKIYGKGNQTRTFCYYTDAIEGIMKVIESGLEGETYNIGNDNPEISMLNLVELFRKVVNKNLDFELTEYPKYYPKDEPMRRLPSIGKARKELGFNPKVSIEEGLIKTWSWAQDKYLNN